MKKYFIPMMIALPLVLVGCDDDESLMQEIQEDIQDTKEDIQEEVDDVKEDLNINTNGSTTNGSTIKGNGYEITEIGSLGDKDIVYDNDGYYDVLYSDGSYGLMDSNGNILFDGVDSFSFEDGIAVIENSDDTYYYVDSNGKMLFDKVDGKSIAKADTFDDPYTLVELNNEDGSTIPRNYVIDRKGNVLLESPADGQYFAEVETGKYVLIDGDLSGDFSTIDLYSVNGALITPEQLDDPDNYENFDGDNIFETEDLYFIKDDATGYYAIYDVFSNQAITDYVFETTYAEEIEDNYLAYVIIDGASNTCLVDTKGNIILNFTKEYAEYQFPSVVNERIILSSGDTDKSLILDRNGKVVGEVDFSYVYENESGEIVGRTSDMKLVYLNDNFKPITDTYYDYVGSIENNTSLLVNDGILYKYTEFED